ncbi:hypothetical protein [Peribacillus simplex]|uniref:hypothetical protein n=1 Tax=Peribacillus TaxID=2675229 RepID=UPI0036D986D9
MAVVREKIEVEYPIGHKRRRKEGIPLLEQKFKNNVSSRFPSKQTEAITNIFRNQSMLEQMPVHEFVLNVCYLTR